jgi:hypothetical protein
VLDIDVVDTMEAMSASLVYLLVRQVPQTLTQLARDDGAKDVGHCCVERWRDRGRLVL